MKIDTHAHAFNYETIPEQIYFGRHGLGKKTMNLILTIASWVKKNGLPSDVEEILEFAVKLLPLFGLDDDWERVRELIRMFYMPMPKLIAYYEKLMVSAGVKQMNLLIPNFQDRQTMDAVDIVCAAVKGNDKFHVFAPLAHIARDDVHGAKFYPALEGNPEIYAAEIKCCVDLGKPIISHSSPGGVRSPRISESKAKYLNMPGHWIDYLRDLPLRLCLAHGGGRSAFVQWFARDWDKPGKLWPYDTMMNLFSEPSEYPGRLFIDVSFHEDQTRNDYRTAVSHITPAWKYGIMFGTDFSLMGDYKTAASWFRNVWGPDGVADAEEAARRFM